MNFSLSEHFQSVSLRVHLIEKDAHGLDSSTSFNVVAKRNDRIKF